MNPALEYHILTEEEKREICGWRYAEEYAVYNLPPWEEMTRKQMGFCHPARAANYRGFNRGNRLVGFTNILEEEKEVFLGIGVHPDFCGQGYGQRLLEASCAIAGELYPGKPLYLEVRTWNKRAIRCYEKAGFHVDGAAFEQVTGASPGIFYRMVKA